VKFPAYFAYCFKNKNRCNPYAEGAAATPAYKDDEDGTTEEVTSTTQPMEPPNVSFEVRQKFEQGSENNWKTMVDLRAQRFQQEQARNKSEAQQDQIRAYKDHLHGLHADVQAQYEELNAEAQEHNYAVEDERFDIEVMLQLRQGYFPAFTLKFHVELHMYYFLTSLFSQS
jgi:hypothetical protein